MKDNKIDYTRLNDRIVKQAYVGLQTLSESDKRKLIEDKLNRAIEYQKSLKTIFG